MSAANKIAQELTAIPQEFQDKAIEATLRSQFWEIIDCSIWHWRLQSRMAPTLFVDYGNARVRWH